MSALLDDEMLDAFTVMAAPDQLADKISDRHGAAIEHVLPGVPSHMSETTVTAVQRELRSQRTRQ
ncbi:MAG TPA: hypothetical protein VN888_13515 [Mycobacterium sp.]|jgi:hypothetical protein|nr:hypothetical protein [Mycobacterium sp.]